GWALAYECTKPKSNQTRHIVCQFGKFTFESHDHVLGLFFISPMPPSARVRYSVIAASSDHARSWR
uniref:Uncharacterized protein n=1 Tax=Aegilops tauschii subsp. strangulata TaxID=200361 RepID=A0A453MXD5_AEGTS